MNGQITIFDWMSDTAPLKLGYVDNGEQLKGEMIPFHELKNYIGKRVLLEMPRQSAVDYKVILITDYFEAHKQLHDVVGYSDDNRTFKQNACVSEMFCKNGHGTDYQYPECMYEINGG